MIVVGFDPGATIGVAELEIGGTPIHGMWAHWRDHQSFRVDSSLEDHVSRLLSEVDLVAVEDIQHQYGRGHFRSAKATIAAAKIGERISTIARVLRKPVVQMTASRARTLIVGRNNPSDETVQIAVRRLIRAVPKRTNAHTRDAAVVALAVGWSKPHLQLA